MKILVINPFGIGDVLFTTPLIRALKDAYADSLICYWCNQRVEPVLKENPCIDRIIALSRGDIKKILSKSRIEGVSKFWGLIRQLKKEKFDVCFDFSLDSRYGLITKLIGIKKRIGYNYKGRGRFLTHKKDINGYNSKHIVEYYLELLGFLNIKPKSDKLKLFASGDSARKAEEALGIASLKGNALFIGISPGAGLSWGKDAHFKHWPAKNFAELSDRLIDNDAVRIVLLGDGLERDIADIIVGNMHNRVFDMVGKLRLDDYIGMLSKMDILVANDGGPLHMAVALGLKTVSIFGPVDERVYGPYPPGSSHIVMKKDMECRPCYKNFRFSGCDSERKCIQDISVEEVYLKVKSLL